MVVKFASADFCRRLLGFLIFDETSAPSLKLSLPLSFSRPHPHPHPHPHPCGIRILFILTIMVKTVSFSRLSRLYLPVLSTLSLPRAFYSFSLALPSSSPSSSSPVLRMSSSSTSETAVDEDPYIWLEDVEAEKSLEVSATGRIERGTYILTATTAGFSHNISLPGPPMRNVWPPWEIPKTDPRINAFSMSWNRTIEFRMLVRMARMKTESESCSIFGRTPKIQRESGERRPWTATSRKILNGKRCWTWTLSQRKMVFRGCGRDPVPCLESGIR
jgi:hypothetical protein